MIPKTIHYCWFGDAARNARLRSCIESWSRVMPDYAVKEWNESNSPMSSAYVRTAYKHRLWSKISNFIRLYAVYKEGGIYLDVDVEVIKRFDGLLGNACFLGFQQPEKLEDWVNNAVFGAVAGHSFLRQCMNETLTRFLKSGTYYRSPQVTTLLLRQIGLAEYGMQRLDDIQLYPAEYFYPYPWWETLEASRITDDTHSIHHWQLSWLDAQGRFHDVPEAAPPQDRRRRRIRSADAERVGSLEIQIIDVVCFDDSGERSMTLTRGRPFRIDLEYEKDLDIASAIFTATLEATDGAVALDAISDVQDLSGETGKGGIVSVTVDRVQLPQEEYTLTVSAYEKDWAYAYDWQHYICTVKVEGARSRSADVPVFCWTHV